MLQTDAHWNIARCINASCGQMWLTPRVVEDEIGECYRNYYTSPIEGNRWRTLFRVLFAIRRAARRAISSTVGRVVMGRYWRQGRSHYLDSYRGRALEVGCGAGRTLVRLRALGWDAEGQDVDAAAVAYARTATGCTVHLGRLEALDLPGESFDAILTNHVIEHVYDPGEFLRLCRKLLKPGGKLVAITPNAHSYLHHRFRESWRDLDPPRHIQVFNPQTLLHLAIDSGFGSARVTTTPLNSFFVAYSSMRIKRSLTTFPRLFREPLIIVAAGWLALVERIKHRSDSSIGEECVLEARPSEATDVAVEHKPKARKPDESTTVQTYPRS